MANQVPLPRFTNDKEANLAGYVAYRALLFTVEALISAKIDDAIVPDTTTAFITDTDYPLSPDHTRYRFSCEIIAKDREDYKDRGFWNGTSTSVVNALDNVPRDQLPRTCYEMLSVVEYYTKEKAYQADIVTGDTIFGTIISPNSLDRIGSLAAITTSDTVDVIDANREWFGSNSSIFNWIADSIEDTGDVPFSIPRS